MASDLEKEAAKLLERLIQESKDDPPKLATKLYLLCDYMKMKGKENTVPFRVISSALKSVVNRNGLDMNALMEAAPRHFIPQSGEGASGGNTSKENELITNLVHVRGEETSGKSAEPCVGHVTAGLAILFLKTSTLELVSPDRAQSAFDITKEKGGQNLLTTDIVLVVGSTGKRFFSAERPDGHDSKKLVQFKPENHF